MAATTLSSNLFHSFHIQNLQTEAMAPHTPKDAPIEQGQQGPTRTGSKPNKQEETDQLRIDTLTLQEADKPETEEQIEPKAAPKKKPDLAITTPKKERTRAWVETQMAPEPLAPETEFTTPSGPLKQTVKEKNAEVPKYLVVGLPKTPAEKTTRNTSNQTPENKATPTVSNQAPANKITPDVSNQILAKKTTPTVSNRTPAKKTIRSNSTTDKPPITMIHRGPGLAKGPSLLPGSAERGGRMRRFEEADFSINIHAVNAQSDWKQREVEGESRFNLGLNRLLAAREIPSSPVRRTMPTSMTPRRDQVEIEGEARFNLGRGRTLAAREELASPTRGPIPTPMTPRRESKAAFQAPKTDEAE